MYMMICDANKEKWLKRCGARLEEGDTFDNVVWTDECTCNQIVIEQKVILQGRTTSSAQAKA